MNITDNKTIRRIQEEFSKVYPGLKIEFYKKEHRSYAGSPSNELIDPHSKIGDIRGVQVTEDLVISSDHTVGQLEEKLKNKFGLNAQIFRKPKDIWLQTSATDSWTLEKQNSKGLHSRNPDLGVYGDIKSDIQ